MQQTLTDALQNQLSVLSIESIVTNRLYVPAEAANPKLKLARGLTSHETLQMLMPGPSHYQTPQQNALMGRERGLSKSNMKNAPLFTMRPKVDAKRRRIHRGENNEVVEVIEPNLMRQSPGVGSYETGQAVLEKHIFARRRGSKGGSFARSPRGLVASASPSSKGSRSSQGGEKFQQLRVGGLPPNIWISDEVPPK